MLRNIAMGTDSLVLCVAYMRRNSRKATGTQDTDVCIMVWPKIGLKCSIPTVRSWQSPVGGHGSLSLLFMTKLMVWYFVTDTQRLWPYSSLSCAHLCHVTCKLLLWSPLQSHRHGFQWLWWMFCIQIVTRDIYIYICLKGCTVRAEAEQHPQIYIPLCVKLRCLIVQGQGSDEIKLTLTWACWSLNNDTINFFLLDLGLCVLANLMTESSRLISNSNQNSETEVVDVV